MDLIPKGYAVSFLAERLRVRRARATPLLDEALRDGRVRTVTLRPRVYYWRSDLQAIVDRVVERAAEGGETP